MKLGLLISVTGLKVGDFLEGARLAREMGYDCVELGGCVPGGSDAVADLGASTADEARELAGQIRGLGLGISALQCHVDYIAVDPAVTRERVDHTRRMIDLAAAMGVGFVHTVSGPLPDGTAAAEGFDLLAKCYHQLLAHAAGGPVQVGIEPVFVYHVGNLASTNSLMQRLEREDLYINFDPSHFPYHREDLVPFIHAYAVKILHCHSKDAEVKRLQPGAEPEEHAWDMGGGEQFKFAPPGQGVLDWPGIIAALREVGFDGVISLELGHGIADELDAARGNLEFLRPLVPR